MDRERKACVQVHVHEEPIPLHRAQNGDCPRLPNSLQTPKPSSFYFCCCPRPIEIAAEEKEGNVYQGERQVVRAEELVWYEEIKYNKRKRYATFW